MKSESPDGMDNDALMSKMRDLYQRATARDASGKRYFGDLFFTESTDLYTTEGPHRLQRGEHQVKAPKNYLNSYVRSQLNPVTHNIHVFNLCPGKFDPDRRAVITYQRLGVT